MYNENTSMKLFIKIKVKHVVNALKCFIFELRVFKTESRSNKRTFQQYKINKNSKISKLKHINKHRSTIYMIKLNKQNRI